MSQFVGADTRALIGLSRLLKTKAEWLERTAADLAASIRRGTWFGPDADVFASDWSSTLQASMTKASDALRQAGSTALRNAIDQDQASGGFNATAYGDLLQGEGWSDIINFAQDVWPWKGDTVDDIGGYADNVNPDAVHVDAGGGRSAADIYGDIDNMAQGAVGDCWLMSALAATAQRDPDFMDRHINANGDGSWTVTIYDDGKPVEVRVEPGDILRRGAKNVDGSYGWMSVYEAAALKHNGGELYKLVADSPAAGLEMVTGHPASQTTLEQPRGSDLERYIAEGRPITAMSDPLLPLRGDVAAAHVYIVESYNSKTDEVTIVNPWGSASGGKADRLTMPLWQYNYNFVMTGVGPSSSERNP